MEPDTLYAGPDAGMNANTHTCLGCETAWRSSDSQPVVEPLPNHCYYCGGILSADERLRFLIRWEECDEVDAEVALESECFDHAVYPICSECRHDVLVNRLAWAAQEQQDEQQRVLAVRMCIASAIAIVALWIWVVFFERFHFQIPL